MARTEHTLTNINIYTTLSPNIMTVWAVTINEHGPYIQEHSNSPYISGQSVTQDRFGGHRFGWDRGAKREQRLNPQVCLQDRPAISFRPTVPYSSSFPPSLPLSPYLQSRDLQIVRLIVLCPNRHVPKAVRPAQPAVAANVTSNKIFGRRARKKIERRRSRKFRTAREKNWIGAAKTDRTGVCTK